jgi:hypothetical protein
MALPAVPADTTDLASATAAGFWGRRTDPISDGYYTVAGAPGPAPRLEGSSPSTGPAAGGTTLTLTGSGLKEATSVALGQVLCTGIVATLDTSITAVTPAGPKGANRDVIVTTAAGYARRTRAYAYT